MNTQHPTGSTTAAYFSIATELGAIRDGIRVGKENPLSGIIADDAFSVLRANDLINEKALRDYVIRQMFLRLKSEKRMRTAEAIKTLMDLYPYLQYDTIRKIVYRVYPTSSRKSMI